MNSSWPGSSEPQTADGVTIIEFLDDVMQDRTDGFKTHHRIAAAKELIVHIVRDEQPDPVPGNDSQGAEARNSDEPAHTTVVPAKAGTHPRTAAMGEPAPKQPVADTQAPNPEPNSSVIPAKSLPRTRYGAGIQRGGGRSTAANPARTEPVLSTAEGSAHPEPNSSVVPAPTAVVPAKAGTHPRDPDPGSQLETNNSKLETLPARRTRTQRRREGAARAAILRQGSERNKDEKPAPAKLTPAERRIREKLKQHWHEPDPYSAPIDSTHPGRSPPS